MSRIDLEREAESWLGSLPVDPPEGLVDRLREAGLVSLAETVQKEHEKRLGVSGKVYMRKMKK